MKDSVNRAVEYIRSRSHNRLPETGLILGSGLGPVVEAIADPVFMPYGDIPEFPETTVAGHSGRLVTGELGNKQVVVMQGRFHYYEGHDMERLAFPVMVMAALGIRNLIVTSASGGVNRSFKPGDLMFLTDHINVPRRHPVRGYLAGKWTRESGKNPAIYSPELISLALAVADELNISVRQGVYTFMTGPSFETPAEINMIHRIGGDVVGMSTVPEALVANVLGIRVLGLTYVSNMGSGISAVPLKHEEVLATMDQIKPKVIPLLTAIVQQL